MIRDQFIRLDFTFADNKCYQVGTYEYKNRLCLPKLVKKYNSWMTDRSFKIRGLKIKQ